MKRYLILLVLVLEICNNIYAQAYDSYIKDLMRERKYKEALVKINTSLKSAKHDTTKIGLYLLRGVIYQRQRDYIKAFNNNITIDESKANTQQRILLYNLLGVELANMNKLDSGIYYSQKAIKLIESNKLEDGKAYSNLSFMYQMKEDSYNQLSNILKAHKIFTKTKDQEGLMTTNYTIGNYYFDNNNLNYSEKYLLQGLELRAKTVKDKKAQAFAGFHQVLSQIYAQRKDYKKAISYANNALAIDEKYNNLQGQGLTSIFLARYYLALNKYDYALKYCEKGIIVSDSSQMFNQLSDAYSTQGDVYLKIKAYEKAISSYKSSQKIAKELGLYRLLSRNNKSLYEIFKLQNKYDEALYYAEDYKIANDSVLASENTKKSKFLLAQFEAEQKDKKILEQELTLSQEKVKSNQFKIGGLIISLLVCVLLIALVYNRYRNRYKISEILKVMQENLYEFQASIKLAFNQSPTQLSLIDIGENPLQQLIQGNILKENFLNGTEKSILTDIKEQTYKISKEIERKINKVKTFSYSISHDLRQPIRQALMLSQDTDISNPVINEIMEYVKQANDLVNCYTALAEIEAYELDLQEINLKDLVISEVRKVKKLDYFPKNAEINVSELGQIWGDPLLVRQIIWNLISNAVKYSSSKPMVKVDITLKQIDDKELVISITDNGIGFSPLIVDRLFLPFVRVESSKKYSGFGIGLALCKQIIEKLGGRIWAESDGQSGATFYVALRSIQNQLT